MNFLKSVLSSSGGFPGYTIQEKIEVPPNSIFSLHNAVVRDTGAPCSVFTFETSKAPSLLPLAKNYVSKLRSLKLPGVVKFQDSLEIDGYIYIATERVAPLAHTLAKSVDQGIICWGLYHIASTIAFLNTEATTLHGNLRPSSVFVNEAGEWKLAGFETLTCMKDEEPFIISYGSIVPDIFAITPSELQNKGFSELRNLNLTTLDSWQFACLVWNCFNGPYSSASSLSGQGKIPNNMFAQYRRLLSPSAQSRLPVSNFLDFGRRPAGFFRTDLIEISESMPSLSLKPKAEVELFLEQNKKTIAALPIGFSKNRVLPELIKSFEFGGGGATALSAILTLAKDLAPADVETMIAPMLLRVWSSKDRAVHLVLLESLKDYLEYLTPKQINDKLFAQLGTSFTDPAPIMRETAIRQIMILTPHLTDRNINGDLLKYLAKTANDQQPGIRTNTTICLGKIAPHLGSNNKRKVLTAAFSRSLKDPFMHARMAALQAVNATSDVYDKDDLAMRIMPGIVTLLIDPERSVRDQARKTLDTLLGRLEKLTSTMPDTINAPGPASTATSNGGETPVSGAIETAGVWAGWAVSTLSRNIDSSSNVPTLATTGGTSSLPVTRVATPTGSGSSSTPSFDAAKQNSKERPSVSSKGSGLKLSSKVNKVDLSSIYAQEVAEDFGTGEDAWGAEDWNEEVSVPKPVNKARALAKPLAKSTSKMVKTVPPRPKSVIQSHKDEAKDDDGGEDWDTDAW
ncbi:protein of unknown function [Taphrina deformans PYCC 5710]|uniref:Protein kinase domain-containing protein n=1 Tax=Taphrina deformans (strain PYCC 5710 / ATCC 11124 / CBS 356.35 / IMI 108563 / JCM 9778 / NBRC 8474) TaxID=1097556 RepID=R4XHM7_TAPDE|nr:protein of unknown function [Taphrina deformans PYCC 5710]|eukprot:CCG84028.1 protein of unknown function [Taphrina deformans PYCC 5710]